jgi:hypothetical protein
MNSLMAPHEKLKGCEVKIPETCFIVDGKPLMIAKCDKD